MAEGKDDCLCCAGQTTAAHAVRSNHPLLAAVGLVRPVPWGQAWQAWPCLQLEAQCQLEYP